MAILNYVVLKQYQFDICFGVRVYFDYVPRCYYLNNVSFI